jgi:nitrite reductase (NADH) small subunit/3-phenylpropionate/trans-cinnamate dioxygenase ferredoxin subunit
MALLKSLLEGRPGGLRARLRARLGGAPGRGVSAAGSDGSPTAATSPPSEPAERALTLSKEPPRDVTPPEGFEVVLHREALPPGQVIEIIVGGRAICVANVDGTHYALGNACAHQGGPLGEGELEGHAVRCPYHGWQFDVRDGTCLSTSSDRVPSFRVQLVGDAVCVAL